MQRTFFLSCLFCLSLIVSLTMGTAAMVRAHVGDFQAVEQPLFVNVSVTGLGLGLMGLELWWFLGKPKPDQAGQ